MRLLKAQAFVDENGRALSYDPSILAKDQKSTFPNVTLNINGKIQETSSPNVNTLINITTLLASQISIAFLSTYYRGVGMTPIPALVQLWKKTGTNKDQPAYLEPVLQELASSGLLYHADNDPLGLIAGARRARFPSLFQADNYFVRSIFSLPSLKTSVEKVRLIRRHWSLISYFGVGNARCFRSCQS